MYLHVLPKQCVPLNHVVSVLQVSTYKIVTVNATRHKSDQGHSSHPNSRATTVQPRLTPHPEDSATVEHAELHDELHERDRQSKDEMQTWMLLEVSSVCMAPIVLLVIVCTS